MTRENRNYLHRLIYIHSLLLAAVALPVSEFLLSLSQFFLAANWLTEGNFKAKWQRLKTNKPLLIFLMLFFIHLIWLINTVNFAYALHDIKIKLPLLVLPVIISTTPSLSREEFFKILRYFNNSVFVATLIMFALYWGCCGFEYTNVRNISVFISHIRFSLMLVFSIFIYLYFLVTNNGYLQHRHKMAIYAFFILWQVFFLFLLHARTGLLIFFLLLPFFLLWAGWKVASKPVFRILYLLIVITVIIIPVSYVSYVVKNFYRTDSLNPSALPVYTPHHHPYYHNPSSGILENGHYVWTYISYPELKAGWEKISEIPFDSLDKKGQRIKFTLIRYLTSKGLTKDAEGIAQLTPEDVKLIENGETNYLAQNKFSLYYLIYRIVWEIDVYRKTGNANNHSVTQRYEFLKVASSIIKEHFWFGTGTGDVNDEYLKKYQAGLSSLHPQHWLRAHNQFVTFWVTFGITGLVLALIAIFLPPALTGTYRLFLFNLFLAIIFFSFLNEDTLETQMGVTFFSFFYTIFVFGYQNSRL